MDKNTDVLKRKIDSEHPYLAGEHPLGDFLQVFFFLLFLAVWVVDSFVLHITDLSGGYLSLWIRLPISLAAMATAVIIARKSSSLLFESEAGVEKVIYQGVFRYTRHPLYLSVLIFYLALMIFNPTLTCILLWAAIFLFYNFIAGYEERLLIDRYGQSYIEYRRKVSRWIPGL